MQRMEGMLMELVGVERQFAVHVNWMQLTGLTLWITAIVMRRDAVKDHKSGISTSAAPPQGWASSA